MQTRMLFLTALVPLFQACSAALVPETDDPRGKLRQARELFRVDRPIPAERLIREAMDIARQRGDHVVLGEAQYDYALFLRSRSMDHPFFNQLKAELGGPSGMQEEARRYLRLAQQSYLAAEPAVLASSDPFHVSNLWWRRHLVHTGLGERVQACGALDQSLATHRAAQERKPGTEVRLAHDAKTYDELIKKMKAELGCLS